MWAKDELTAQKCAKIKILNAYREAYFGMGKISCCESRPATANKFCILCNNRPKNNLTIPITALLCLTIYFLPNNAWLMKSMFFSGTIGGVFFFTLTVLTAQITGQCGISALGQDSVETEEEALSPRFWLWRDAHVTGGQLTLPFKIRRNREHDTFRLTTDVTLGGYVGYTRRLSEKRDFFLTVPLTAGLTFINLNDNNTTLDLSQSDTEVVPGLTWSMGVIVQLGKYNLGLLFGKDYASSVGNQWEYHSKLWWSFGIGFVFLQ